MKQNIIAKAVGSQRIVLVVGLEGVPVVVEQVKDIINAKIHKKKQYEAIKTIKSILLGHYFYDMK